MIPSAPAPAYPRMPVDRPRRRWLPAMLTVLLAGAVLIVLGGAAASAATLGYQPSSVAHFVTQARPEARDKAIEELLARHAKAVRESDEAAFLADVDRANPDLLARQKQVYANLTALKVGAFDYERAALASYDELIPDAVRRRFPQGVRAAGIEVRYQVDGVDAGRAAAAWVPVFGLRDGRWLIADEVTGKTLPAGTKGQPWEGGPITVVRSARVTLVLSPGDAGRAPELMRLAETGMNRVAAVRPSGWAGRILVVAVRDEQLLQSYFRSAPDQVGEVAAIAVPVYAHVPEWRNQRRELVTTRIVVNPQDIDDSPEAMQHVVTHEFAHAAMEPLTGDGTPRWLIEGIAEYIAYQKEQVPTGWLQQTLRSASTADGLPGDADFYDSPTNYTLAWLACRMIAEKYGEAKLLAFYAATADAVILGTQLTRVLGIDEAALTTQWRAYVEKLRTGR